MVRATVRRDGAPQGPARFGLPPLILLLLLYPRGERGLRLRGRARARARSQAQSRAHGCRQQSSYHCTGNLSWVNFDWYNYLRKRILVIEASFSVILKDMKISKSQDA